MKENDKRKKRKRKRKQWRFREGQFWNNEQNKIRNIKKN